jgi:hypothetical protein
MGARETERVALVRDIERIHDEPRYADTLRHGCQAVNARRTAKADRTDTWNLGCSQPAHTLQFRT